MGDNGYISADAWAKGVFYSVLASIVGGASKLAIRKSWLMVQDSEHSTASTSTTAAIGGEGGGGVSSDDDSCSTSPANIDIGGGHSSRPLSPYQLTNEGNFTNTLEMVNTTTQEGPLSNTTAREEKPTLHSLTALRDNRQGDHDHRLPGPYNNVIALSLRYSGMFGMTILNPLFCVLAMNYASPSILAPFSGLTLVWIILFSEQIISERPQTKQVIAAGLIITGQVTVGVFGDHTNDDGVTLEEIVASYKQVSFQLFFVGMTVWMSYLAYLMIYPTTPTLRRFAWGVASGSITGFQNFLKDSLSVVKACENEGLSLPWYFYILATFAGLTAFAGLLILTACMKRYDATFSSSMFVGSFIISATIMASIHYHTFAHLVGVINWIMYPAGLGILMVGLYLLVQDTEKLQEFSSVVDSDGEDTDENHLHPNLSLPLMSTSEDENSNSART